MAPNLVYVLRYFPSISETFIAREIACLARRGAVLRVLAEAPEPGCRPVDLAAPGVPVVYLGDTPGGWLLGGFVGHLLALARRPAGVAGMWAGAVGEARRSGPGLRRRVIRAAALAGSAVRHVPPAGRIHAHFANDPAVVARYAARASGRPFTFTAHAYDLLSDRFLLAENIAEARRVVTVSEENRALIERLASERGIEPAVSVVHCGIDPADLERIEPVRREEGSAPRLLSVGRLIEKKGHATLIRALALLDGPHASARLTIVGDGPLADDLRRIARESGVEDRLDLAGSLPFEEVRGLLASADVFVLASTRAADGDRDGIPVALIEAMAAGLPVVSTRQAGVVEAVPEGAGLLVPPDDPERLARAVASVLEMTDAQRGAIRERARRAVRDGFDLERCADRLLEAISV